MSAENPEQETKKLKPAFSITLSETEKFLPLATEGVSSKVFIKDGKIYKLNTRLSFERQMSDLKTIQERLAAYPEHIPNTEVGICVYEGVSHTCVVQPLIDGDELKKLPREVVEAAARDNKAFLEALLAYTFSAIEKKELCPDIVGFPQDQDFFNSINLMLERSTGRIILCDVNLSPHEDTLKQQGVAFYQSSALLTYLEKMREFQQLLKTL